MKTSVYEILLNHVPSRAVWTPKSVPGLYAWYDAGEISGLSDGDPVTQWDDESDSGYHVSQAVGVNQPVYKTAILNGLPVVRFDADLLKNDSVTAPGSAFTCFAVAMTTVFITWKHIVCIEKSANERNLQLMITSTAKSNMGFSTAPGAWVNQWSNDAFQAATFHIAHGYYDGSSELMGALDDDEQTSTPGGTPLACTELHVGGSSYQGAEAWAGDIAEIIIYNELVASADRTLLYNYLVAKYGL